MWKFAVCITVGLCASLAWRAGGRMQIENNENVNVQQVIYHSHCQSIVRQFLGKTGQGRIDAFHFVDMIRALRACNQQYSTPTIGSRGRE